MNQFKPMEMEGMPVEEQFMNWDNIVRPSYDKMSVDPYTRTKIILMNGIETNAVLTCHAIERMTKDPEVKRLMSIMRRVDSMQQQTVNWLNAADQTVLETTIAYEQVAVDLTANLAKNEPDPYIKDTLDFALLEDFDHLFRFGCMLEALEGEDPELITQAKTEIKPGRPTILHHRHPNESMRKHYNKDQADLKTKMNYLTITSGEQQTMLFYKEHGFMYPDELARKLYSEIADVEEEHVTQYGVLGDPEETMLEKMAMMELCEAYNYYSCAQTETDDRIKRIWENFTKMEITHFKMCAELLRKYEGKNVEDLMQEDKIKSLIVFEPNKEYVNKVLEEQIDLMPNNMEFVRLRELPDNWSSFKAQQIMNSGMVPSEEVVNRLGTGLAEKATQNIYQDVKQQMADRIGSSAVQMAISK
ncbi:MULTISPECIES: hypothetical protein [Methanobacterium]|uniref:Rubrerythrin n=1 Tax=Methanobacterium bryantii TaxID=2161 RepID=A0A2A2H2D8_METBR|nr:MULTISPECIES: hypothetical protein [Methanobacterium]OEC88154.1 hypothetical protein A9507_06240 [Methanobacterium sp. A39]PAV03558.1 hypothetical protein ASJ80_00975 [Methanobacterium bryantii]